MERVTHYKLVIAADHRGFKLKEFLKQQTCFATISITWIDVGCFNAERCDYPQYAQAACNNILQKKADAGILLCASGIGMALAANRFPGIYAGVAWNTTVAQKAREDDNITVLALPTDFISEEESIAIITAWLTADFKQGRYADRLKQVDLLNP